MKRVWNDSGPGQRSRRAALYWRAALARSRARLFGDAVFDGVALGLLNRVDLADVDARFYAAAREHVGGASRAYTDEQYIRSGLWDWEERALDKHFTGADRILVTSAGSGREVLGLLERGFDPSGFEPNPGLVEVGSRVLASAGYPGRLIGCARDEFPASAGDADGLLFGWASYMLIQGRTQRIAFLRSARERVPRGAPLLLSYFLRPVTRYFGIVRSIAAPFRMVQRSEPVELGDALTPNFVHHFTSAELDGELRGGGFRAVAFETDPYAHAVALAI